MAINNKTKKNQTAAAAGTWSYDDFKVSDTTKAADTYRQTVASQKPSDFSYGAYTESDAVKQANTAYQQQLSRKPGAYQSQWQTQMDDVLDRILNREDFSYDINGDALYQQYKDQYMLLGQQAMMDTMGQAAALTGGYGNSYAQTAGQQTYQGYLQQLNDKVPELYQLALDRYNQEGQDLYNQYGLYADRENQDYGRYRDTVSDYNVELARLAEDARYLGEQDYGRYMDAYNMAYGQHRDSVSDWQYAQGRADEDYWKQYNRDYETYINDRNMSYQANRDQVADNQWQQNYDESVRQYNQNFQYQQNRDKVSDEQWDKTYSYQQDRDKVSDSQWKTEFDENKRRYDQEYAASQTKSYGSGGSYVDGMDDVEKTLNYKAIGFSNYNDFSKSLEEYVASNGNKKLSDKLDEWVRRGYLDEATADELYAEYARNEQTTGTQKSPGVSGGGGGRVLNIIGNRLTT